MQPDQYTPDAICWSMGLSRFIEPRWPVRTLRLLLKPSFDPEVCLTLHPDGRLTVVAAAECLWHRLFPFPLPTWRESVTVPEPVVAATVTAFEAAAAVAREAEGRMICIDGMPVAAVMQTADGPQQFAGHPVRPAVSAFVVGLIRTAWEACRTARVRNALAACGRYERLDLPREPEPPVPQFTRVVVMGDPPERTELLDRLRR